MRFASPLTPATLRRRYKRFLADVALSDGRELTVHCANPGSMLGCAPEGASVLLSRSQNPKRKLPWSWELVRIHGTWVGINTSLTNRIVEEALRNGDIPELGAYESLRREVPFGDKRRVDFLLESGSSTCHVEVKNVTLARGTIALFPDSVTTRGKAHVLELGALAKQGKRAVLFFLINREDCELVGPASSIDPAYSEALRQALDCGVEVLAYRSCIDEQGIAVGSRIPFDIDAELRADGEPL